ncbi:M48 family metalloprotease [Planctomycetales bacterium ZRK34]|nr:M48 family metalloprotease [Planctomycetales bacterium ZRK34]
MAGMFYNLGRALGPKVRKGKWIWTSMTGDDAEILEAEHAVGRDLAEAVRQQTGVDEDPAVREPVKRIGKALTECVANKQRKFAFEAVPSDEPNAFALPGGYVFVTRPLIQLIDFDEDALAFVLGHEMGHIIKQHALERIAGDTIFQAAMKATPGRGAVGQWAKSTGNKLMRSAYSQDNEFVADQLGSRLAGAAGFNPNGAIAMFEALQRIGREREGGLWEYFSSHPPLKRRIAALTNDMKKRGKK